MSRECYLLQPSEVDVFRLKDGTDIILRKNIEKVTKEPTESDGEAYEVYECDEVQVRVKEEVSKDDAVSRFDYFWELGITGDEVKANDTYAGEVGEPTVLERLEAIEGAVMELAEVISNG